METFTPCQQEMDTILMQFKQGDAKALDKVYSIYAASMLFTARGIIHDEQEAEDIVLDAFQKCWKKRECFESMYKLKCYLYVVVKHACFHYREKMKARSVSHKELGYMAEDQDEYILQRMIKAEMIQRIYSEISRLPEKARTMLTMLYVNEMNTSEISATLQIPMEHVRVNKFRALNQLKQALSGKAAL